MLIHYNTVLDIQFNMLAPKRVIFQRKYTCNRKKSVCGSFSKILLVLGRAYPMNLAPPENKIVILNFFHIFHWSRLYMYSRKRYCFELSIWVLTIISWVLLSSHNIHSWVKVFRINPEFRILRLTFHRKSASKCWIKEIIIVLWLVFRWSKHH